MTNDNGPARFPIGTRFTTRGKHPNLCTVTDILKTYNSTGDLVRTRYVATHEFLGQTVTSEDIVETTIARGFAVNHYESAPYSIGHHEWRLVIYNYEMSNGELTRCTRYEWQDRGQWRSEKEWPSYNDHDGTYAGLPRTLRKLYEREKDVIENIIYGKQPEPDNQLNLFAETV